MLKKSALLLTTSLVLWGSMLFAAPKTNSFYPANKAPLPQSAFSFLPLGAVKPQGWLRDQLQIQANGLTGNLPKFWKDLGPDSGWLGGGGESWERGPYYMDGMVPLAFLLGDKELMEQANKWVGWTLDHQKGNGWIGPEANNDWWPIGIMTKVLTQYQEATGDPRVIPVLQKFFRYMQEELPKRPLGSWGQVRWADTVISVDWLYNRTGDPSLLELSKLLKQQGFDWAGHFNGFAYKDRVTKDFGMHTHGVNNAMAVKTPGVMYEITGDEAYKKAVYTGIEVLDKYHGQAAGVFSSDEHYAGKNPSQGTELCAVVEYMFSLENLMELLGDPAFGDRLEKIAFNALPATFSPDMWAHQYDQQANQVVCRVSDDRLFATNGPDSNLFGLEPNFGCCTANMHQGWPKLVSHLWMATPDDGLAAVTYAPCVVSAKVRGGSDVTMTVDTNYPFDDVVKIRLATKTPVSFPLKLRVPAWTEKATAAYGDTEQSLESGKFATIERLWKDGDTVTLKFPMPVKVERRFNNSATITRGPLVYSLRIEEKWNKLRGGEPHADYEVYPTTAWNYGLILDTQNPAKSVRVQKRKMNGTIFSSNGAPIEMRVKGRMIPEWQMQKNAAGTLPVSPVKSDQAIQDLTLIPYGCAKLRVTEFPLIDTTK